MVIVFLFAIIIGASSNTLNFTMLIQNIRQPLYARQIEMGRTVKNNPLNIYLLTKIPFNNVSELYGKNVILVDSLMHAREPYSTQMMSKLFTAIIQDGYEEKLDYFLRNGIFIFYPFVNSDGYQLSLTTDSQRREQIRKNLNTNHVKCSIGLAGVDINRNFPSDFATVDTSSDPCSQQYHGVAPFSQKEAIVFKEIFNKFKVLIAIDIHSYGNDWIYPYASDMTGQKVKRHKNYHFYQQLKRELKDRRRRMLSCIESLGYTADGVYIDWALDNNALSFAFQVGKTFRSDSQASIRDDINQAIQDFYAVFKTADFRYTTSVSRDKLFIKSKSLANMTMTIKIANQSYLQQIKSGEQISLLTYNGIVATIMIKQSGKISIVPLIQTNNFNLYLIGLFLVSGGFLAIVFYVCHNKIAKKDQEYKINQLSLQEIPTISQREQISINHL